MGESIADDDRRISRRGGDNVCVVVVKVKNMGRGGLVALVINPEVNSLAPHSERRVRLLPWAHGSALSSSSSCSDPGSALVQGVVERRIQEWSGASQLQTKLVVSEKACRTSSAYGIIVRGSLVTGRQERSRKRGSDRTCVARSPGFHHESRQPAPISHPCRRRAQSPASAASRICSEIKARMIT